MTHNLKPGDRVRVATTAPISGCRLGDKGTVVVGPILRGEGEPFYIVTMDKGGIDSTSIIFRAEQIEPDV